MPIRLQMRILLVRLRRGSDRMKTYLKVKHVDDDLKVCLVQGRRNTFPVTMTKPVQVGDIVPVTKSVVSGEWVIA